VPPTLPALPPSATTSASPATPPGPPTAQPAGAGADAFQSGIGDLLTPSFERQESIADLGSFRFKEPIPLLGDLSPLTILQTARIAALHPVPRALPPTPLPRPPRPGAVSQVAPSTHSFKIADNQSPMPQDRAYFTFNDFDNLNAALNRRFDASVKDLRAYRYIVGLEKTFNEEKGSVGIQLPLDSLTAESTIRGSFARPGGTSNSLDDLTVFGKYILERNPITGSLISAGLAVTPRTGPPNFAGANYLVAVNDTTVQPFLGYLWRRDRFYLHGFAAIDVPTSVRDVTMVYNDVGIGYYAYRNPDPKGWLMALVPTFEVHVNDPLTHGDFNNRLDLTGTPDIVNLTYGINALVGENSVFTFGFVTPVTGPRPFDYEIVALINIRLGRTRGPRVPPPILGG
jgi:hypothetical protein